ncbi:hypothetical protein JTE90_005910 [Oedothorax gibbosus]|uniref:C2H2-type domain-containing protein n=1 Tax=Oedothorax gibbosus TaxID=931172 RepID=A0AAV6UAV9_9ARAC|nr:hypothetical protein JTE90_005910 [Oedothorax gibbosus]
MFIQTASPLSAQSLCFDSKSRWHCKVYFCIYCPFSSLYTKAYLLTTCTAQASSDCALTLSPASPLSPQSLCFDSKSRWHRKVYLCLYCPFSSLYTKNLKAHMAAHQTPSLVCERWCGHKFKTLAQFQEHLSQHLIGQPYRCPFCNGALVQHYRFRSDILCYTGFD